MTTYSKTLARKPHTPEAHATQDHTGQQWLTSFEESGVKIMGKSAHELKQLENTPEFERTILVRRHACHQGLQLASVHGQVLFTAACLAAAWVYLSSVTLASCGMHSNRLFGSNQRVQRQ